jgi:hypothetical protein
MAPISGWVIVSLLCAGLSNPRNYGELTSKAATRVTDGNVKAGDADHPRLEAAGFTFGTAKLTAT